MDIWQFAVEIASLERMGLALNEFRWLLAGGYVQHAEEVTEPKGRQRQFRKLGPNQFPPRTCFVLTESGVNLMEGDDDLHGCRILPFTLDVASNGNGHGNGNGHVVLPEITTDRPCWDPHRRELRVGQLLVKRFRQLARNQELILSVFEEEGWPRRIDDPLPPARGLDRHQRLYDTLRRLNRNQVHPLLHFRGDGTGDGIAWEFISNLP